MGRELLGVVALNALFLASGLALLAGLAGWKTWLDLLDSLGLALVLGTCAVAVLGTLVLIAGGGMSLVTIVALAAAVGVSGAVLGILARRPLPRRLGRLPRLSAGNTVALVGAAATVAILVELMRKAQAMPLGGGDAFEDWVPRAKIIYFFGEIDTPLFTGLPGPRYPILVPTLQAMDFRFMGSAYGPELAVQYWFLFAGFVLAAASILRRLVPAWLAWLFVSLTAAIPELAARVLNAQADWALDLPFALAALVVARWLQTRERWLVPCLGILLAAVIATKQEGLLLVGCLYAGLAAATWRHWRHTWPPLVAAATAAYLVNLPWRIWWGRKDLPPVHPTVGLSDLVAHLHRGWESLQLVLRLLFDFGMWFALVPIALAAAAAALTLGGPAREAAITYLVTAATAVAGFTYILWDDFTYILDERQSSTPIPRAVGSIVLLSAVFAPLLIAPLLRPPPAAADDG